MSTNDPMTQERLDAIRERVENARGPWTTTHPRTIIRCEDAALIAYDFEPDDADLIVHAPDDLADLLAEVKRLRHFESIVSSRYGDTSGGMTRDAMVERAARAMYENGTAAASWGELTEPARAYWRDEARAALDAALGTGEGA